MKKYIRIISTVVLACLLSGQALAAGELTVPLMPITVNPHDQASLQRGARYYMNYCSGCHSLEYMRYGVMAKGIGITDSQGKPSVPLLRDNLMFNSKKVGETIKTSVHMSDAAAWFGAPPPDLSLIARVRGASWLYTYLNGFYADPSRVWGTNNSVFKDVGMPNVLLSLQGEQKPIYEIKTVMLEGKPVETKRLIGVARAQQGAVTPAQFEQITYDIVNFLSYVADPVKIKRHRLGVWVLLFLVILGVFAYLLKREYWKDVH